MLFDQTLLAGLSQKYRWNPSKRFDIVEYGRLIVQTVGLQLGRSIAGLRTLALERLDQRSLFAAHVTTRADEHLEPKGTTALENVRTQSAQTLSLPDGLIESFDLLLVLVPNVDVALFGTANKRCHRHALDNQMRCC